MQPCPSPLQGPLFTAASCTKLGVGGEEEPLKGLIARRCHRHKLSPSDFRHAFFMWPPESERRQLSPPCESRCTSPSPAPSSPSLGNINVIKLIMAALTAELRGTLGTSHESQCPAWKSKKTPPAAPVSARALVIRDAGWSPFEEGRAFILKLKSQ